jgi:ribonuclease BN (tRNA processing enzyme)
VRLTVVGCAGSYPGPDSAASCYLVQAPHQGRLFSLVLDMGNGALGALQRYVRLEDIDTVALSHLHVDHCIDLLSFYVFRTYRPRGKLSALPVLGPHATAERIARAADTADQQRLSTVFDFADWHAGEPVRCGPFTLTAVPVVHPVEAYAIRVEHEGRVLVYSGDTGPCEQLVPAARGADLLLCEASFLDGDDNPPDLHLTGRQAGEYATAAGVPRLVLTHVPAWHDAATVHAQAGAVFDGELSLAEPGASYEV